VTSSASALAFNLSSVAIAVVIVNQPYIEQKLASS
jgi:hypothetical protein